jgi:hypothetical protein
MATFEGNLIDKLGAFVPGYKGYKEKEMRRDTDRMLRGAIIKRLLDRKPIVDRAIADLSSKMQFDHLERLNTIKRRLDNFADSVKTAPAGYSGFFDTLQVNNNDLDRLYRHDLAVRDKTEEVVTLIGAIASAKDVGGACEHIIDGLQGLGELIKGRDQAITEIK